MDEYPVTGFCEQCRRRYSLLIPVPGSGDLELERVEEIFGWCTECGQYTGRACCWGTDLRCARCVDARADPFDHERTSGRFAAIAAARAAVRRMDGTASAFSVVEDALAAALSADANAAGSAWEDAWLAAGALRTRVEGARDAAISQLRGLPPSEVERVRELEQDLAAVVASHDARWQSIVDSMAEAGRRVAANVARDAPLQRSISIEAPAPPPTALSAMAIAVPVPVRAPDRATIVVAAVATTLPVQAATSRPPQLRTEHRQARSPAGIIHAASTAVEPIARTSPALPSAEHRARRRRTAIAVAMLVGIVVVGGSVLAQAIGQLRTDAEMATNRDSGVPGVVGGVTSPLASHSGQPPSPSLAPPTGAGTLALSLDFDLLRIGALDVDELAIARLVGAPEVTAFPTPFDRSLRLTGSAAGVCLEVPVTAGPVSSMAFDLHLGEAGSTGKLIVGLSAAAGAPASGLAIDLAILDELDRDAWYRLIATSTGASGRVTVRTLDDDRRVLEAELAGDEALAPTSRGEACLSLSALSTDASVFVDNLRLGG